MQEKLEKKHFNILLFNIFRPAAMMGGSARVDLNSSFSATPPKIEPKPQHHIIKHTSTSLPRSHHKKKLTKCFGCVLLGYSHPLYFVSYQFH